MGDVVTYRSLMGEIDIALNKLKTDPGYWFQYLNEKDMLNQVKLCQKAYAKLGNNQLFGRYLLLRQLGASANMAISLVALANECDQAIMAIPTKIERQKTGIIVRAKLREHIYTVLIEATDSMFIDCVARADRQQFVIDLVDDWLPARW